MSCKNLLHFHLSNFVIRVFGFNLCLLFLILRLTFSVFFFLSLLGFGYSTTSHFFVFFSRLGDMFFHLLKNLLFVALAGVNEMLEAARVSHICHERDLVVVFLRQIRVVVYEVEHSSGFAANNLPGLFRRHHDTKV